MLLRRTRIAIHDGNGPLVPIVRSSRITTTWAALIVAALWMLVSQRATAEQTANCRPHSVAVVHDDPSELTAACKAFSDIVAYFGDIGFAVPAEVSIRFAEPASGASTGHSPVHGLFDALRSEIVIYRATDTKPWGQAWSPKFVASFLRHEIAHLAIWQAAKANRKPLRTEWHEFIAYAIQLDLMDPELRTIVLAAHADVRAVGNLTEINEFSYGMNPQAFAVLAYKTYLERGGATFVRQLLKSEIMPPHPSYPFAVLPHEVRE